MKIYSKRSIHCKSPFGFSLLCLLLLSSILTGCSAPKEPISQNGFLLDTVINITIYDTSDTSLLSESFAICEQYEQLLSRTIEDSDISKINKASGKPVSVSKDTIELIKKSIDYSKLSNGAFDITISPLSDLWDFKNNKKVPDQTAIDEAKSLVNYHTIKLTKDTVTLENPRASIDLGAIAKGFIADKIKTYLISEGVTSAIIDLGGNVLTIGSKPDGSSWNIGIQKPFDERNTPITSVSLKDESVVTSGVYERYFEKDGIIYHHILDPSTGYPYENGLLSVSILSESSVDGDALSTTCFALGLDKGMAFIESLPGVDAIFITDDEVLHDSRNQN